MAYVINVQKKIIFFALCTIVFIISGCSHTPQISKSVSAENFSKYEVMIRKISNRHNLAMNELDSADFSDSYDAHHVSKNFSLSGDKDMLINVYLSNDALENEQEGEETFLIAYSIPKNKDYDLDLFVELVNAVSGRTISTEYCEDFLNNLKVSNRDSHDKKEAFSKSKPLNWESNWVISYTLRDNYYPNEYLQELKFTGFTKAMT